MEIFTSDCVSDEGGDVKLGKFVHPAVCQWNPQNFGTRSCRLDSVIMQCNLAVF